MADDERKLAEKLARLRAVQAEHMEKAAAVGREMDTLLSGGVGIGEVLKRLEKYFDAVWCVRYAPGQTNRYVWAFVKDVPQLKRLLKTLTVEDIERRMLVYLQNPDTFFVRARHAFGLFVSTINQHADMTCSAAFDLEAPTVAGCQHTPRCVSDQEHTKRRNQEMRA